MLESNIEKNILFIGAGASFGARQHQKTQPPLGNQLLKFLFKNTKEIGQLRPPLSTEIYLSQEILLNADKILKAHCCEKNFEKLLPKLNMEQRNILHRSVQILFSDLSHAHSIIDLGFREQSDLYDHLIYNLRFHDQPWIVISLNYDTLFETALSRNNIEFYYPEVPIGNNQVGLAIYKPHGSINFLAKGDFRFNSEEPGRPMTVSTNSKGNLSPQFPITYAVPLGAKNVLYSAFNSSISYPIMANYTSGKDSDINVKTLENIRNEALSICSSNTSLLIIGVNPILQKNDDPFCSALLSQKFKYVTIVDPYKNALEEFRRILPEAKIFKNSLGEYVKYLCRTSVGHCPP